MFVRLLPLITGLLPVLAIHASLLLAINAESIPSCFPYIDGCVSISAVGRYEPANFIFKPAMMSEWTILVVYWLFSVAWIRAMAREARAKEKMGTWMGVFGCAGALALILYVTFLGTQEPFYEFMRRFGVYLYFLFTVVAQIILARHTITLSRTMGLSDVTKIGQIQMALALVPFALGVLTLVLKATLADPDPAENIIEWLFALLMHIYFVLTYFTWRETCFDGRFRISLRPSE